MFSAWYDLVVMETQELEDSFLLNKRERVATFAWKESERKRKEHRLHACTLTDGLTQEHGNSVCESMCVCVGVFSCLWMCLS